MTTLQPATRVGRHVQLPRAAATRIVLSTVVAAWIVIALAMLRPDAEASGTTGHTHLTMAHHGSAAAAFPWSLGWIGHWMLMVVAMMWPLAIPTLATIGRAAYRSWRVPLLTVHLGAVTLLWLAAGLALASVARLVSVPAHSAWWQVAWVGAAVAAMCSARRTRVLWRCARLGPLAPAGRRGLVTAVHAGFVSWRRCALLCGPAMGAMVVGHAPVIMVCASASAWWEATHARAWRDPVPVLLLGAALVWTAGALVPPTVVGHA